MEGSSKSSPLVGGASWMLVLPSVADLIFVALLGTLLFTPLSSRLLGDADIGWHIRTGQQILATHAIPHADSFSSTMQGKPWFAWEWLYDVVAGWLEAHLGLNGVVWLTAVVIATVFAWVFRLLIVRGTNLLAALVLYLLAVCASTIHFLARPHVLSWLFTLASFVVLDSSEREGLDSRRRRRTLWLLPLLMLVWVNVHGGFLVGFVLLGIFWLAAVWEWSRASAERIEEAVQRVAAGKTARDLALVGVVSAVASLCNPYGWRLYAHAFSYLSNRFLMDHIDEFRSPDFHSLAPRIFVLLLLVTLTAVARGRRELRVSGLLTLLFAVYTGVYSARNIPVSSLLLVMIVGPLLRNAAPAGWRERTLDRMAMRLQRLGEIESRLRVHLWPAAAILLTLVVAANGGSIGSVHVMDAHFDPKRMPVAAVDYLEKHALNGPVLTPDYWGGYVIYRLYPKNLVVVDDRHDLYGEEFFKSYLKFDYAQPGWDDFLRQHEAGCVLLPKDSPLNSVLPRNGWTVLYSDDVAMAYVPERSRR